MPESIAQLKQFVTMMQGAAALSCGLKQGSAGQKQIVGSVVQSKAGVGKYNQVLISKQHKSKI